jgi:RNA polymerase primary sigma factor
VDETVSLYLKEMSRVPLLSAEEEVQLAQQMRRGELAAKRLAKNGHDPEEREHLEEEIALGGEARAHLIKANTRLVVSIAKKYLGQGVPFLDLIQAWVQVQHLCDMVDSPGDHACLGRAGADYPLAGAHG